MTSNLPTIVRNVRTSALVARADVLRYGRDPYSGAVVRRISYGVLTAGLPHSS